VIFLSEIDYWELVRKIEFLS